MRVYKVHIEKERFFGPFAVLFRPGTSSLVLEGIHDQWLGERYKKVEGEGSSQVASTGGKSLFPELTCTQRVCARPDSDLQRSGISAVKSSSTSETSTDLLLPATRRRNVGIPVPYTQVSKKSFNEGSSCPRGTNELARRRKSSFVIVFTEY